MASPLTPPHPPAGRCETRRLTLLIGAVVLVLVGVHLAYTAHVRRQQERHQAFREARLIADLYLSLHQTISGRQAAINVGPGGEPHFKGVTPEGVLADVSGIFTENKDLRVKITRLQPRNPRNAPDPVETEALRRMERDVGVDNWQRAVDTPQGTYYYQLVRIDMSPSCLHCHGGPRGVPDITGHPREGWRVGQFAGALSVRLTPQATAPPGGAARWLPALFIVGLSGASLSLVGYLLTRLARLARAQAEANLELADRNQRLAELERLKDDLFHMVVHDLKAPLTFMQGSLQMLQEQGEGALAKEQDELLDLVLRGCRRLSDLTANILDIGRLEEGRLAILPRDVQLGLFVNDLCRPWRETARQQRKGFETRLEVGDPVIDCDPFLLGRILENLLANAFKHTSAGEGRVTLGVYDDASTGGVRFEVVDNGPGIPAEALPVLFDKFTQAAQADRNRKSDTGLGLTFCKLAVSAMGGEIGVDSRLGRGSVFWFVLPRLTGRPR